MSNEIERLVCSAAPLREKAEFSKPYTSKLDPNIQTAANTSTHERPTHGRKEAVTNQDKVQIDVQLMLTMVIIASIWHFSD